MVAIIKLQQVLHLEARYLAVAHTGVETIAL